MNKSPAFQFYPDKWQSHTRRLSDSAYRVYHEVICWMWQHSPDQYSICKDADGIACALAMQPHTICKAIEEIQNPHAPLLKDEGERYISNGLKKEAEKQIENRQKKSKNAHARWDMQKQSGCNAVASIPQCSLIPSPIPSPSPIQTTLNKENTLLASTSHGESKQKMKTKRAYSITWTPENHFQGITEENRKLWSTAFPAVNIDMQLAGMTTWLLANPAKAHKSNWPKFVNDWLKRQQDKGGDIQSNKPSFAQSKPAYQQTATFHSTGDDYLKSKGLI